MQDKLLSQAFLSGFMQYYQHGSNVLGKEAAWWNPIDFAKNTYNYWDGMLGRFMGSVRKAGRDYIRSPETAKAVQELIQNPGTQKALQGLIQNPGTQKALQGLIQKQMPAIEKRFERAIAPYVAGVAAAPFVSQLMLGPGGMFGPKAGMSQAQAGQMMGNVGRTQRSPMVNRLFDYQKLNF